MRISVRIGVGLWLAGLGFCVQAHEVTYEAKVCECVGDVNYNGTVDEHDVQRILDCFGGSCLTPEDPGYDCPLITGCIQDVNHNHQIGEGDLDVLLANWGPCPLEGDVNRDGHLDWDDVDKVERDLGLECRTDLDRDGRVSGNDIAIAEAAWGPTRDPHLGSDIDGNGFLSITDLLQVVNTMGRNCFSDVDRNGVVDCSDVLWVCEQTASDCSGLECFDSPSPY